MATQFINVSKSQSIQNNSGPDTDGAEVVRVRLRGWAHPVQLLDVASHQLGQALVRSQVIHLVGEELSGAVAPQYFVTRTGGT
jgi:hypothetical protein